MVARFSGIAWWLGALVEVEVGHIGLVETEVMRELVEDGAADLVGDGARVEGAFERATSVPLRYATKPSSYFTRSVKSVKPAISPPVSEKGIRMKLEATVLYMPA